MHWVCPDCREDFDWATDEEARCVMCHRTSREVRGKFDTREIPPISVWLCVPCGGIQAQPADEAALCFNCTRTFAQLVYAGLMPRIGTFRETPVIEPPRDTAKPIPESPD